MDYIEKKYQELLEKPSDINQHFPLIRKTIKEGDLVVELGVREIVSSWALLVNKPKALLSVDVVMPSNLEDIKKATETAGIKYDFVLADSMQIIISPVDVLFIDTIHTYSQLAKELWRHSEMVKRNIIFHDSLIPEMRACIVDFLYNPHWKFKEENTEGTGLLVLERQKV